MIFHRRLVLHVEVHRGYWPRLSVRWEPRAGDRTLNGGESGTLVRCSGCSGDGLLHVPDRVPEPVSPSPDQ